MARLIRDSKFYYIELIARDLTGKIVVVTGSNTGLGFDAAKHFATMNPKKLILAVRNEKKGEEAKDKIKEFNGFDRVEVMKLDLTSFRSVVEFTTKLNKEERLDIFISNAAITGDGTNFVMSEDGYEIALQTNHIANTLLIHLILPILRQTSSKFNVEPRVVVCGSDIHEWTNFPQKSYPDPIKALNDPKRSTMKDRYEVTKLLNVYMTTGFAKLFKENNDSIAIHCLSPGLCSSELARETGWFNRLILNFARMLIARSCEQGSRTLIHAANSEELNLNRGANGRYFSDNIEHAPTLIARDFKLQQIVWDETIQIIKSYL